jgi:hypothetical protein
MLNVVSKCAGNEYRNHGKYLYLSPLKNLYENVLLTLCAFALVFIP